MAFAEYRRDIEDPATSVEEILHKYFHSGSSAAFSGAPPNEEPTLKMRVSRDFLDTFNVSIHPLEIVICGSAHLGFSPVPDNFGSTFDSQHSDMDLAIVSMELFDKCWKELQQSGLSVAVRSQVSKNLFWGFIDPSTINKHSKFGSKWWGLFGNIKTDRAKVIRGRLYRNLWCMQNYHSQAIVQAIERYRKKPHPEVGSTYIS